MITKLTFFLAIMFGAIIWESFQWFFTKRFDFVEILTAACWVAVTLLFFHFGLVQP